MIERPICIMEGCNNLAKRKSNKKYFEKLCTNHHAKKYRIKIGGKDRPEDKKCTICGWFGPCDIHRIKHGKDGGEYKKGNIMFLCPNCHRLVHRGRLSIK